MTVICYTPIGVVRTPFRTQAGTPLQTIAAAGVPGRIELDPAFAEGLTDLAEFSHLWLLVHLHQIQGYALKVMPYLDDQMRGVFATRSPRRPNPIGMSVVRLCAIEGCTLHIEEVDLLDGTPLLDLKPYVPLFDRRDTERIGWFAAHLDRIQTIRADDRFG
jgi:tRNA-Thr(GGU) m(6)t(6)A37 methyltransferase TsaA